MKKSEWRDKGKSMAAAVVLLWAFGAADGAGMTLAEWRTGQALEGMEAVEGGAKADRTTREALWRFCLETTGAGRVQMGRPRPVGTNEWGATYDVPFETEDGAEQHLGVFFGDGAARKVYWTLEGGAKGDGEAVRDAALRFLDHGNNAGRTVFEASEVLDGSVRITGGLSGETMASPFPSFHLFFSDDYPKADWAHPSRVLFVDSSNRGMALLFCDEPITVTRGERSIELGQVFPDGGDTAGTSGPTGTRGTGGKGRTSAKSPFPAIPDGDSSRSFALLVSGGARVDINHMRYWNEICFVYNVLASRFKVPKSNITVLWSSGDPARDMCNSGTCQYGSDACKRYAFATSDLSDFDLDGKKDINGAATFETLRTAMEGYAANLKPTDQLLVFFSDHGGEYGTGKSEPANISLWGERITDAQLAELTKGIPCPVMFALKTCYSGGMRAEITNSSPNRVVATADKFDPSAASTYMGDWTYHFFGALAGHYPRGSQPEPASPSDEFDPRSAGAVCNADADGDGRVSFHEAHLHAVRKNPFTAANGCAGIMLDEPQYSESTPNLGKRLFMTQYADAAPAVKEKAEKPVLSPAGGSAGYAPATVTASCGTAGATIRYTLDGSEPTEKSAVAEGGKITLTADKTVKVRAFKSGMQGSDTATGKFTIAKTGPAKARIVSVSRGDSSSGIVVDWLAGEGTETCDLLRSESSSMSSPTTIASGLAATVTSWADLTAKRGKTYYYQIRSANGYGKTLSEPSLGAWLMLNPPDGVKAEATAVRLGSATVKITWKAAEGASHYRVWRTSPDGTTEALGTWKAGLECEDTVSISSVKPTYEYKVRAASSAGGANASAYSQVAGVTIDNANLDLILALKPSGLFGGDYLDFIPLMPGESGTWDCVLLDTDGSSYKTFLSGPTCTVTGGEGIAVTVQKGSYSASTKWYTPPKVTVKAAASAVPKTYVLHAKYVASNGQTVTRDFPVVVSTEKIVKKIGIFGTESLFSGETEKLGVFCQYYGAGIYDGDDLPEGTEVAWSVGGGGGATLSEEGELTAWPVSSETNIIVEARVQTSLGEVVGRTTFNILPASAMATQTVVIPPLGGSSTNLVGKVPKSISCTLKREGWISQIGYHAGNTANPAECGTKIVLGPGSANINLAGDYLFISFAADRNPGKDRESLVKVRWSGGGINFTVVQQEAPYAKDPKLSGGADGVVAAAAATDGGVFHYATDGEEPSGTSPVMNGALEFDESTVVAVKAFGEWLQASGTAYADVTGKMSKWDEVKIRFVPGKSGVAAPPERTYKVNEAFGELPAFGKTGGLYFKGWTLQEGSERVVKADESVPGTDATLYGVWSETSEAKPEWTALPWDFKEWMTAVMVVSNADTHALMGPDECSIGIVDSKGTCRGGSENGFGDMGSELHGKNGLHVFGVYSDAAGGTETALSVKVWVKGKGYAAVGNPDFAFRAGETSGSEARPHVIRVGTGGKGWYTVAFDAGTGGSGVTAPQEVEVGTATVLPGNGFRRAGHVFAGWGWTAAGGVAYAAGWNGKLTKADGKAPAAGETVTLYAQWKELSGSEVRIEGFGPDAAGTAWTATVEGRAGNTYWLEESGRLDGPGVEWVPAGNAETPGADGKVSLSAPMRTGVGFFKAMESK